MGICLGEPTIDELLGDSLTQGLMRADGVDTAALRDMLRGLAFTIASRGAIKRKQVRADDVSALQAFHHGSDKTQIAEASLKHQTCASPVSGRAKHTKDQIMAKPLRWIGSLSSVLQAGLDRAVSAELRFITTNICHSKRTANWAAGGSAADDGCDLANASASLTHVSAGRIAA